jgi:hypothetical protein
MRRITVRTLLLVAAAAALVAVGGTAVAASSGGAPGPSSFLDSLAKHLGISRETLDEATKAAAADQVDALLEAGRITEEQAARMKARIESGEGLFFGFGHSFGGHGFGGHGHRGHGLVGALDAAAEYLGMERDALVEELRGGQSLADVAKEKGKSVDGLKAAILADAKARLAQAVKDGELTEEQAEAALERLEEHIDDIVQGTRPGLRARRGWMGPGAMWGPPAGMQGGRAMGPPASVVWGAPA